jgi:hypothetical protein
MRALAATAFVGSLVAPGAQLVDRPPTFEVASIKASTSASAPLSIQGFPGGRLVTSNSRVDELKALMGKIEFDFDVSALRKEERRTR